MLIDFRLGGIMTWVGGDDPTELRNNIIMKINSLNKEDGHNMFQVDHNMTSFFLTESNDKDTKVEQTSVSGNVTINVVRGNTNVLHYRYIALIYSYKAPKKNWLQKLLMGE